MTSVLALGGLMAVADDQRSRADLAMERYADGDAAAFEVLYRELEPRLRRHLERETRSSSAAEDLLQQTFEKVIVHRTRYLHGAPVRPWVYAIARALVIDRHRQTAREGRPAAARPDGDDQGGLGERRLEDLLVAVGLLPDEALDQRRREASLWRDYRALPARHREAFSLVKLDGLSVAEAAEALGLTPANVRVCTHRAAEALRQADAQRQRDP